MVRKTEYSCRKKIYFSLIMEKILIENKIGDLTIRFPNKLVFGKGKMNQLVDEVLQLGVKKVLIITIKPLLSQLNEVVNGLESKSVKVAIDTSIIQEPCFGD